MILYEKDNFSTIQRNIFVHICYFVSKSEILATPMFDTAHQVLNMDAGWGV